MRHSIALGVAASGLLFAAQAGAAQLPSPHTEGPVTYVSGGIGMDQAKAIKTAAAQYPLELEFLRQAKPKDEYLADIKVQIKNSSDKTVLDVISDGPFLLARLPAGRYSVSADNNGKWEHRKVSVAENSHKRVVFEWKP